MQLFLKTKALTVCLRLPLWPGDLGPSPPTAKTALLLAERHNDHIISLPASRYNMEAIAKFDFMASGEDELSFHAGDVLKVGDAGPGRAGESLGYSGLATELI